MGLLNRENILNLDNIIFLIDTVIHRIKMRDVEPVDYPPTSQYNFFLVSPGTGKRVLCKTFQSGFNDPPRLLRQRINSIQCLITDLDHERQSLISERGK